MKTGHTSDQVSISPPRAIERGDFPFDLGRFALKADPPVRVRHGAAHTQLRFPCRTRQGCRARNLLWLARMARLTLVVGLFALTAGPTATGCSSTSANQSTPDAATNASDDGSFDTAACTAAGGQCSRWPLATNDSKKIPCPAGPSLAHLRIGKFHVPGAPDADRPIGPHAANRPLRHRDEVVRIKVHVAPRTCT